jgi:uncharacterized PurR-regulated membrane protein YhhQ (DUF165 family)
MPEERMLIDPHHRFKNLDIIAVIFTLVLVLSNFASSAKIIDWGLSIGKLPLAFDAGTIFFPVAYIFNDVLTEGDLAGFWFSDLHFPDVFFDTEASR